MPAPLIYFGTSSLDGYRTDPDGGCDWGPPTTRCLEFINELFRASGACTSTAAATTR